MTSPSRRTKPGKGCQQSRRRRNIAGNVLSSSAPDRRWRGRPVVGAEFPLADAPLAYRHKPARWKVVPRVATPGEGSHGMVRTEILSSRCGAHLGRVFADGTASRRLRYCVNSESLTLTDAAGMASLADLTAESAPP
jgi:hypothetical protein